MSGHRMTVVLPLLVGSLFFAGCGFPKERGEVLEAQVDSLKRYVSKLQEWLRCNEDVQDPPIPGDCPGGGSEQTPPPPRPPGWNP
jgi:hypothetical protein